MFLRILILGAFLAASGSPAYAYLDPGTGSILLQAIIGGIAAGVTVISLYYQKLKIFLGNMFGSRRKSEDRP